MLGNVSGTSTNGNVTVNGSVAGGSGGAGSGVANGGAGGAATIVDKLTASTTGNVTFGQTATGGNGGSSIGGTAGAGGAALSSLNFARTVGGTTSATTSAVGGNGASANTGGHTSIGGNATSNLSISGAAATTAIATAAGGNGGGIPGVNLGAGRQRRRGFRHEFNEFNGAWNRSIDCHGNGRQRRQLQLWPRRLRRQCHGDRHGSRSRDCKFNRHGKRRFRRRPQLPRHRFGHGQRDRYKRNGEGERVERRRFYGTQRRRASHGAGQRHESCPSRGWHGQHGPRRQSRDRHAIRGAYHGHAQTGRRAEFLHGPHRRASCLPTWR